MSKRKKQKRREAPAAESAAERADRLAAARLAAARERARVQAEQAPSIRAGLLIPPRTCRVLTSIEDVRKHFAPPVTLGYPRDGGATRAAQDQACDAAGIYETIHGSLTQHAEDLGQYPITSFLGYGALQQIAQNGMIRSCITTVSDDITREWIELTGGDETDGDRLEALDDLQARYHLKRVFHDAVDLCGYMGGGFIFIDTGVEGDDLALPLRISEKSAELRDPEKRLRFIVIDPINAAPATYNADNPLRPDYLKPRSWWILGREVHASRLIPIVENRPPQLLLPNYNFLGIPQAQILWDYVLHWNACRVATANLLTKLSLLVYKTDMNALMADPAGIQMLDQKMSALQRYRDNDSVFVVDKEAEDVGNVQTSMAGCTDVVRQSLEMIAAINRTPAVKLLGISPSGFNATGQSDITNYYDFIRSKQELRRDDILRCLKAIQVKEFGEIDESISIRFKELGNEREVAAGAAAASEAATLSTLAQIQAISAEEVREAAKKSPFMRLGFLSDGAPDAEPADLLGLMEPPEAPPEQQEAAALPPDGPRQFAQELNDAAVEG